jgi:hypothetical protein
MLKNIILILLILVLLNFIKISPSTKKCNNKPFKNNEPFKNSVPLKCNKPIKTNIPFKLNNEPFIKKKNIPLKDLYFGKDQYILKPEQNNNKLQYQDIQFNYDYNTNIFNYDKIAIDNKKLNNKNIDNKKINNQEIINNFNKETKTAVVTTSLYNISYPLDFVSPDADTTPLIDQKILYDYRFLDMHKEELENIIHNIDNKDNYNKEIKDIYDDMILDYKKINKKKTPTNKNIKVGGAFNETAFPVNQWFYEEDNNELSFDPLQSLELSVIN